MRKYQQLCLVAISIISLICLLIYRNENGHLKYVLEVVNFFGQKDPTITGEYLFDYVTPFPIWQRISNGFHAYSSFWHKHSLVQGGEVITIVVALQHSIVKFKCQIETIDNKIIDGIFGFLREAEESSDYEHLENVIIYKFICKIKPVNETPRNIIFTNLKTNFKRTLAVHDLGKNVMKHQLVSCVHDISPMPRNFSAFNSYFTQENRILEYFYHHNVVGVDEFIVYDTNYLITSHIKKELVKKDIKVNVLPFNFPFDLENIAKIKKIMEIDCELRTFNISRYFVLSLTNEYLFPDSNLKSGNSSFLLFDAYKYPESNRFEISTNSVCLNLTNTVTAISTQSTQLLSENAYLEPKSRNSNNNLKAFNKFKLYRPKINRLDSDLIKLSRDRLFVNHYKVCENNQNDIHHRDSLKPETYLSPMDNLFKKNFKFYIDQVNQQVRKLKA